MSTKLSRSVKEKGIVVPPVVPPVPVSDAIKTEVAASVATVKAASKVITPTIDPRLVTLGTTPKVDLVDAAKHARDRAVSIAAASKAYSGTDDEREAFTANLEAETPRHPLHALVQETAGVAVSGISTEADRMAQLLEDMRDSKSRTALYTSNLQQTVGTLESVGRKSNGRGGLSQRDIGSLVGVEASRVNTILKAFHGAEAFKALHGGSDLTDNQRAMLGTAIDQARTDVVNTVMTDLASVASKAKPGEKVENGPSLDDVLSTLRAASTRTVKSAPTIASLLKRGDAVLEALSAFDTCSPDEAKVLGAHVERWVASVKRITVVVPASGPRG